MQETLVKKIMLDEFALVKDFIHDTQSEETEVTVRCGKYVVDGKSILGIFSLDLSKPLVVEYYNEEFGEKLKKYEVY